MPLKLVHKIECGTYEGRVYRNSNWNEYIVKLFIDGKHAFPDADYHCDDKQDAIDTAIVMVEQVVKATED